MPYYVKAASPHEPKKLASQCKKVCTAVLLATPANKLSTLHPRKLSENLSNNIEEVRSQQISKQRVFGLPRTSNARCMYCAVPLQTKLPCTTSIVQTNRSGIDPLHIEDILKPIEPLELGLIPAKQTLSSIRGEIEARA